MRALGADAADRRPPGRGGSGLATRGGSGRAGAERLALGRLTVEHVVRPAGPYSLALCIRHANDATRHVRDGVLTTTLLVDGRVELATARQLLDGRVVLRGESEAGIDRLRFVTALDDDHTEFLRRFSRDPLIGEATRVFQGMRVLRLPTVAQALLRAFCGQLIETRRARELEYRIVRAICERRAGTDLWAPPSTETIAALAPSRLRQLGLHARRAAAVVRICRSLDLERLREVPTDAVAARLERERGIGPWTVGVVCLEGLGRTERGLVGDLALIKLMSDLRGGWVEGPETATLLAPYGEWAGLASVYLGLAYSRGLVALPGSSRAHRPPAFFRTIPAS
jgi:AraC family transcriptional regulator of adaptative response / DNA-3-methyladenine glycosylase II